jgi:uncharacterized protein YvpB
VTAGRTDTTCNIHSCIWEQKYKINFKKYNGRFGLDASGSRLEHVARFCEKGYWIFEVP